MPYVEVFASFLHWILVFSPEANKQLTCSHFNFGCKGKHSTQVGVVKMKKAAWDFVYAQPLFYTHLFYAFWI
jgi:hypothetical protein